MNVFFFLSFFFYDVGVELLEALVPVPFTLVMMITTYLK